MKWNRNVHTFIGCRSEYAQSRIVLFGAPFDSTTSFRPGARQSARDAALRLPWVVLAER